MDDELKCPQCKQPIPASLAAGTSMTGEPPVPSAPRQRADCAQCGAKLVRVQDGGEWQLDKARR
jgi:hypothetical protein